MKYSDIGLSDCKTNVNQEQTNTGSYLQKFRTLSKLGFYQQAGENRMEMLN